MLNTLQKLVIFALIISINSVHGQSGELKILSINDALELVNQNSNGTASNVYEREVKSAYYYWIYYINQLKVLTEKKDLYHEMVNISEMKFRAGEINLADKALSESEYLKIELHCVAARNNLLMYGNDLKKMLLIDNDILPENDSLTRHDIPADILNKAPDDSVDMNDYKRYKLIREFDRLKSQLQLYDEQLLFYNKVLIYVQQTISAIELRYKSEDIEYSDYVNVVNDALDLNLDYLNTLNLYNQTALKIEAYYN